MFSINIIANDNAIVNINSSSAATGENKIYEKWENHKMESQRVAKKMYHIDKGRGQRMANCADILQYYVCEDCGSVEIKRANLCRDRFCPTCNWRLSLQRYAKMRQMMDKIEVLYPSRKYSFVTLTVKNCKAAELSETMSGMARAWNNLLHMKEYRKGDVLGYAKSVEVTYNKNTKEFHPHYHILVMWRELPFESRLISNWMKYAEAEKLKTDVKAQYSEGIKSNDAGESMIGAICETFKYAIKSKQLDDMPLAEFKRLVAEIGGKRLVSFGGAFKEVAKLIGAEMEKVTEEDIKICKSCGSASLDNLIYKWSFGDQTYQKIL